MGNSNIKHFFVAVIHLLILFTTTPLLFSQDNSWDDLPNVFVISLESIRNSESIDDPTHQYIPNLWNKMLKDGTLFTNLIDLNNNFHMPVLQAINSGENYSAFGRPLKAPTIFEYVGRKYSMPKTKLWSIGHWHNYICKINKYVDYPCVLNSNFIEEHSPEFDSLLSKQEQIFLSNKIIENKIYGVIWNEWDSVGQVLYQFFKKICKQYKPKLIHYSMADVEAAHYCTFARYCLALMAIDKRIYEIWRMINEDPYYKNNTYLIVTVDHQRDAYYMQHDHRGEEDNVWIYIYGPNVKKGAVIKRVVHHIDIFATIAYLMKVETHDTKGRFLEDCFLK